MHIKRALSTALTTTLFFFSNAGAQNAPAFRASGAPLATPQLRLLIKGPARTIFDTAKDACSPVDMPDMSARVFRDAEGNLSLFALHYEARALRGKDFDHLKMDCASALDSHEDADPARYDGRRFLTSLWSYDGRAVAALVHNEYHADAHRGRCTSTNGLACWWNSIIAMRSNDAARSFQPMSPLVVAAAPFRQDVDQTRHRGFFSPTNMIGYAGHVYAMTSTTGWTGQPYGVCLIRTHDPFKAGSWRGYDGAAFSVSWSDPYRAGASALQASCQPLDPFIFPVGSLVRHRPTGLFLAVWEAPRTPGKFATAGVYYATSKDLREWSLPMLLMAGASMNDVCDGGANRNGIANAYPALIDHGAEGRNFDDVGDEAFVYYTRIKMVGCETGPRVLVRAPVSITLERSLSGRR